MPDLEELQALGASILAMVERIETAAGPQPRLRHLLHAAQAEAESVTGVGPIVPDGGGGPKT